ncbi:tubulin-folding cofactor C-like [Chlorella sorokiniana]|uniref:Tubulin-folding cofactor C-like n=1 Tax=Chlorella sorokiniana TaxID=3076 RepID=A0A2P6U160_CHLSO|nr:tubulin-folding cofactor C-like [Chlorella sorokiniana]|eukprot:PRW60049.1 tubulin-folding cofactor C-like [Chlorella sorokiniana]
MSDQHAGVIEVLEAPVAPAAASGVLARLAEREEARASAAAKRLEDLHVSGDPRESVDAFMEEFSSRRQQLEAALQAASGGGGGGGDAAAVAALAEQIAELEKSVAEATYFLPAYDLRQATLALTALREQQEVAAAALQPRRRFAFNRKASEKAGGSEGAEAAAAAPEQQGGADAAGVAAQQVQQEQPPGQQQAQQQHQQPEASTAPAAAAAAAGPSGTASDGSTLSGLRGEIIAPSREEAAGRDFTLSDLEDCTVFLPAPLAALFLHRLRRCRVYTGPVAGACFVEGAEECMLMIAARQVRIHAAHRSDCYLRVRSHPIIEHSSGLRFAPYAPSYEGAAADLAAQGLEPDSGMWQQVNDFGWLRATPSPHWQVLPEGQRAGPPRSIGTPGRSSSGSSGDSGGSSSAHTKSAWAAKRREAHATWDLLCGCCALVIHSLHFANIVATVPARQLPPLLLQMLLAALTVAGLACRRGLYTHCRPLFTVAVRLGLVLLPAVTLGAAYRANLPPLPGTPLPLLAWRVLLASRACVLLVPAISRRSSLLPHVGLSLLALTFARQFNEQACATPLFQDSQVQALLSGISQFAAALASPSQLASMEPGAAAAAALAAAATLSCTRVVTFLQLALGCVLPTALFLWSEGGLALRHMTTEQDRKSADWEQRLLAWVGTKREESGAAPFLLPSLAAVAGCWLLSGVLCDNAGGGSSGIPQGSSGSNGQRASKWDLICGCCTLAIHGLHCARVAAALPARQLAPLLGQVLLAALTLGGLTLRRGLYTRCRPLFTVAVRLGMVSLPAVTLSAAYHADVAPPPGASLLLLAWRVLLASCTCVLLVPAISRRTRLLPQVALSLLALALARQLNEQTCATPLFQDSQERKGAGWELRVLAWVGNKREESGAAPFLLPSLAAVAGCWLLSGVL